MTCVHNTVVSAEGGQTGIGGSCTYDPPLSPPTTLSLSASVHVHVSMVVVEALCNVICTIDSVVKRPLHVRPVVTRVVNKNGKKVVYQITVSI